MICAYLTLCSGEFIVGALRQPNSEQSWALTNVETLNMTTLRLELPPGQVACLGRVYASYSVVARPR